MNRVAVVVALALAVGSVPAAAALTNGTQATVDAGPEPGATFAGVIGVQEAEVDGEIARRTLAERLAAAEADGSRARIVAEQQGQLSQRLDELEAEKARLERAHENGSIGEAAYRARLAALAAQLRTVERQANRTASVAASLPEVVLRDHGVNVSRVRAVAQHADRTGGGAVAEAAREIAGEGVGNGLGPPNGTDRGPPESVGPSDGDDDVGPPDGVGPDEEDDTEDELLDTENGTEDELFDTENGAVGPPERDEDSTGIGNGTRPGEGSETGDADERPSNGSDANGTETDVVGTDIGDEEDDGLLGEGTETPTPTA